MKKQNLVLVCMMIMVLVLSGSLMAQTHIYSKDYNDPLTKTSVPNGGDTTSLGLIVSAAYSCAADNNYVYLCTYQTGAITRVDLDGNNAQLLFTPNYYSHSVDVNLTHIFIGYESNSKICRANIDGSNVNTSFVDFSTLGIGSCSGYMEVTTEYIFAGGGSNNSSKRLVRADIDGLNKIHLLDATGDIIGVTADESWVYWRDQSGNVGRCDHDGNNVNKSWISGLSGTQAGGIDVSSEYLYALDGYDYQGENLCRFNLDGTGQTVIGSAESASLALGGEGDVVPVTLTSFTSVIAGEFINISWTVESESAISKYNLYRSENESNEQNLIYSINAENLTIAHTYEYQDSEIEVGIYTYWLEVIENDGSSQVYDPCSVEVLEWEDEEDISEEIDVTKLIGNYPNPFNGETTISLSLTAGYSDNAKIEIYNMKGQRIDQIEITNYELGFNQIIWNSKNQASGIYLYKLIIDGKIFDTKRMTLLK